MALFVMFGWTYLTDYAGVVAYLTKVGAPTPAAAGVLAILMEFFVGIALALGYYTRPLAALFALYTIGTGLIGHRYWSMSGTDVHVNYVHFFKNVSIAGGLLLLSVIGPGRYSLDRR